MPYSKTTGHTPDSYASTIQALGQDALLNRLAHCFYEVVDPKYQTFCSLTSQIIKTTLDHFGVPCTRVPCQLWYTQPNHVYVIGFLGKSEPGKWDGHVVCRAGKMVIDAATHHFQKEFGFQVPSLIMTPALCIPSVTFAHITTNSVDPISWQAPPPGVDATPPDEPAELVNEYVQKLVARLAY